MKVLAFGTFDLLHKGHMHFLKEAKKHGKHLTVIVAHEKNVERIKGRSPIHDNKTRLELMEKSGIADKVLLGKEKFSFKWIEELQPDVICLGYDQESNGVEEKFPTVKFVRVSAYKPHLYKSSKLREKIRHPLKTKITQIQQKHSIKK